MSAAGTHARTWHFIAHAALDAVVRGPRAEYPDQCGENANELHCVKELDHPKPYRVVTKMLKGSPGTKPNANRNRHNHCDPDPAAAVKASDKERERQACGKYRQSTDSKHPWQGCIATGRE